MALQDVETRAEEFCAGLCTEFQGNFSATMVLHKGYPAKVMLAKIFDL